MAVAERRFANDLRARNLAARSLAFYRATARPELDIAADINAVAERRVELWREVAEIGPSDISRELVAELGHKLDHLYEELRITRMVTA
jgi:hypothetical protein